MGWQDAPAVGGWQSAPPVSAPVPLTRRGTDPLSRGVQKLDAFVRGGADTSFAGFADEIAAGVHAPVDAAISAVRGRGFNLGDAYDKALAEERGIDAIDTGHSPVMRGAGQVAGAIFGPGGKLGAAERLVPRVAGALAGGAAYGFGSGEGGAGSRAAEAGKGALLNAAGGEVGRVAAKAVGRVLAPAVARVTANPDAAAQYPHAANVADLLAVKVPLTPGQIAGGAGKWAEEVQSSIPVAGLAQKAGQARALEGFNRGGINKALAYLGDKLPMGVKGTDAMQHMQGAFNAAYDKARAGMHFEIDNEFANAIGNTVAEAKASPVMTADALGRLQKVQADIGQRLAKTGGALNGDALKKIISDYKANAVKLGAGNNSATDQALGGYIGDIVDHIDEAARRNPNTDPAAVRLMDKADEGYAYAVRLEEAARMRGGESGSFTATQLDRAVQKSDKTARNRAYLRGDALFQNYAKAGQAVLPNRVPNSGTPERAAYMAMLGGGFHFAPGLAAAGLLGAIPYAPGAEAVARSAMTRRPAGVIKAGLLASKLAAPAGSGAGLLAINAGNR